MNTDIFFRYGNDELFLSEAVSGEVVNGMFAAKMPYRSDYMKFMVIRRGVLKIRLDYEEHILEKNSCIVALPVHMVQRIEASDDFDAAYIAISRSFVEETLRMINHTMYNTRYIHLLTRPFYNLSTEATALLLRHISEIREKVCDADNRNLHKIVKCVVMVFLLETENVVIDDSVLLQPKQSRYEQIYYMFLQLLIKHYRTNHNVEFYADLLSITQQHLAFILKKISGKTTYQWISEVVITEAKIMLKDSGQTVQQIADSLNFQDAALFSKFFKKHAGVSPSQFKKINKSATG